MAQLHHRCTSIGLCVFITMIPGSDGALTIYPSNKAVPSGPSRVNIMSCASDLGLSAVSWSYVPVGGSSTVNIAYGGLNVAPGQNQSYAVEQQSGSQQINLIILSATPARAGTYICNEATGQQASAQLIVFNSNLVCSMIPNAPSRLLYNQTVQMSCSINYTANASYATVNMSWSKSDPSSTVVESPTPQYTYSENLTTATSNITQVPGYMSSFPSFNCTISFKVTGTPPGSANNPLDYSKSMQVNSPIEVIYLKPADANSITGPKSGEQVYLGTTVTCTVDGNPKPNYSWLNVANGNTTNTSAIQIWNSGEYKCTAWNTAGSTSASINVTTYKPGGISQGSKVGIGVGIGVGMIVTLGGIIVSAILCRRYDRNKRNKTDDNTANRKEEDSKRTHGDNSNVQHYEPLNVLSAQASKMYQHMNSWLQPPMLMLLNKDSQIQQFTRILGTN